MGLLFILSVGITFVIGGAVVGLRFRATAGNTIALPAGTASLIHPITGETCATCRDGGVVGANGLPLGRVSFPTVEHLDGKIAGKVNGRLILSGDRNRTLGYVHQGMILHPDCRTVLYRVQGDESIAAAIALLVISAHERSLRRIGVQGAWGGLHR